MGFPFEYPHRNPFHFRSEQNVSRIASASAPQPHCMNINVRFQPRVRIRSEFGKRRCTRCPFLNPLRFNRMLRFNNFHPLENPLSLPIRIRFGKIEEKNISRSGSSIRFRTDTVIGSTDFAAKRTFTFAVR